jgi:hypothetical protein
MTPQNPVFIFGAGASKACGGPLTDEILFESFSYMPGVSDCAESARGSRWRLVQHGFSHVVRRGHSGCDYFRSSILCLQVPLSTLRW